MNNKEYVAEIVDIICNRVENMVKSVVQTHLENRTESEGNSSAIEILTVDELARLLKVSKPIAYELANRDDFPSFKIGKSIRIYQSGLTDWLAKQAADQKG